MTKISIMLPDYNGGELVRRSIESVLAQTYTDYVLYLIDNGSTKDNTREILHSYTGPRIVHVDVDVNNGTSSAYNAVLKKIDTPWVAVIHADDMWYPTKLEKQMAFLEQHPDYCILGTWYDYVDINDKVIGTSKEPLTTWEKVAERYNNDKMVSSLTFGFWTKLFTRSGYKVGGKTLLRIFPNKAKGKNQADIYLDLTHIREFRNRIAHHEPICFDGSGHINTTFARTHYQLICDYIFYLGQPSDDVVSWAEKPDSILNLIDKMTP